MWPDSLQTPTTSLLADQRSRWDRGERLPVEHYLSCQPDLRDNTEVLLDLIYAEVVLRREAGEHPLPDEYVARFPALAEPIRTQFEVDEAIDGAATQLAGADNAGTDYRVMLPRTPTGYELMEQIGHGGMGVVYKARQIGLDRWVAIKMIRSGDLADPKERARFDSEAQAVARLSHPNIIQIYEVGETESGPYLAIEYVPGKSLADILREMPFAPREAATLLAILARAVDHAHEAGIVHRDLKPANILLGDSSDGMPRPKITDFGLAKRMGSDKLTQTGDFLGTPSFTAPEQAAGKADVGPRADIYSLGAILYQTLTGRPPFAGASPLETLDLVRFSEPVSLSRLRPNVPRDLETITLKCLNKEPTRRYRTAGELADDLERYLRGEAIRARPVGNLEKVSKWCRRRPAFAAMIALVMTITVAGFVTITTLWQDAAHSRDAEIKAREEQRIEGERADARSADVLIANARHALITSDISLARRTLAECPPNYRNREWEAIDRVCRAGRILVPPGSFAVDSLCFDRTETVLIAGATSGLLTARELATGRELFATPTNGRAPVSMATNKEGLLVCAMNTSLIEKNLSRREGMEIVTLEASSGKVIHRVENMPRPIRSEVSPDGRYVSLVLNRSRSARLLDPKSGEVSRSFECKTNFMVRASFSANGRYVLTAGLPNELGIWRSDDGKLIRYVETDEVFFGYNSFAVSNDGNQVAIGLASGAKPGEIVLLKESQKPLRMQTQFTGVSGVAFSANDKWLAAYNNGEPTIRVWDVGTGREEIAFRGYDSVVRCIAFAPDSKHVVAGYRDGLVVVWTIE